MLLICYINKSSSYTLMGYKSTQLFNKLKWIGYTEYFQQTLQHKKKLRNLVEKRTFIF